MRLFRFATVAVLLPAYYSNHVTSLATQPGTNRRDVLQRGAASVIGGSITPPFLIDHDHSSPAAAAELPFSSSSAVAASSPSSLLEKNNQGGDPILVLGASGKTGRACVQYILQTGRSCIATTRTGIWPDEDLPTTTTTTSQLTVAPADVTNVDSLHAALALRPQWAGVIYAASASRSGGTAAAVDRDGAVAAARACLEARVPRFVLVSSGAVTQPNSVIYQLLNSFGKIMEAKWDGEQKIRSLYAAADTSSNVGYTIVRPGGLTLEPAVGAARLELNQGDAILGRLPRADVAALCVEACFSPDACNTTFECYEAVTAKPVGVVGFSNLGMLLRRRTLPLIGIVAR